MDFQRYRKNKDTRLNYREMEGASIAPSIRIYLRIEGDKTIF
jgi:hypothetical protein